MTPHEVLVRARNLIADERDWCGNGPRNQSGGRCAVVAVQGVIGDAVWFTGGQETRQYEVICNHLFDAIGLKSDNGLSTGPAVGAWNDSHSHAEVLAAFDKAIAATAPEPDTEFLNNVADPVAA